MLRLLFPALLTLLLLAPGCGRPMMVTPTIFADGAVDPFFEVPAEGRTSQRTVFYATDRLEDHPGWGNYGRRQSDTLDLGSCDVQFDGPDNWQTLEQLGYGANTSRPDVQVAKTHRLGDLYSTRRTPGEPDTPQPPDEVAEQFLEQLNTALAATSQREVTVYIHGFKNGFHEAVKTAGEYAHYSGNQGVFVCYSWPSYNSLWEYSHDREAARFTGTHLRRFVLFLAEHSDATKINFIAHSTGCQVVGTLMRELRLLTAGLPAEEARERFRIGQVFMVAPDIDAGVARERFLEEGAADLCEHLTIYSSRSDYALGYASRYLYRQPRLGMIRDESIAEDDVLWLLTLDNLTLIDIDRRPTHTFIGHTHQRYNPAVSSDILLMLRRQLTPAKRALVREEGMLVWRFCEDYEQCIRATAREVYPAREED